MRDLLRRWWPYLKMALGLVIVAVIGFRFAEDLRDPRLWERPLRAGLAVLSGALYLVGLLFSALTWWFLLARCGQKPRLVTAVRAYYLGHLAKYLPGKAWALFLRADLVRGDGVRVGVGVLTAFYEVLVTMSGAVLAAAVLFALFAPDTGYRPDGHVLRGLLRLEVPAAGDVGRATSVLLALGLLAAVGVPALPPVFNRVAPRVARPFGGEQLSRLGWRDLGGGLLLTCTGWLVQGASLGAALCAVVGTGLPWTLQAAARVAAIMGVSYVAGFVIVVAPSGLGVREFFLTLFLTPELLELGVVPGEARGQAILTTLVLRVAWTAAELVMAAVVWPLPAAGREVIAPAGGATRVPPPGG
jgi:hypothetical protein